MLEDFIGEFWLEDSGGCVGVVVLVSSMGLGVGAIQITINPPSSNSPTDRGRDIEGLGFIDLFFLHEVHLEIRS